MSDVPPVVFLPGIMGSRLYFPKSGQYWDPDTESRMVGWVPTPFIRPSNYLRNMIHVREPAGVLVDAASGEVTDNQVRRGWGTVSWNFYGPILKSLEKEYSTDVYAVGYDWRQSLRRLGQYTAQKIERILETSGSDKVTIVTHSMGGLVARSAFAVKPEMKAKVKGVVYVCQPCVGAVVLYRRMFTGLVSEFDASPKGGISGHIFDRLFSLILGGNRSDFLGKISGMPGAVSLLPSDYYPMEVDGKPWLPELNTSVKALELFAKEDSPPGIMPSSKDKLSPDVAADFAARIEEYRMTQELLGPPDNPATYHPNSWVIYGTGLPTETYVTRKSGKFVPEKSLDGDGTVPSVSATALPVPKERTFSVPLLEHSAAFSDAEAPGRNSIRKTVELVKRIASEPEISLAETASDPLASFQVIGKLDEKSQESKIRELVASSPSPTGVVPFSTTGAVPFGIFDWLNVRRDDPWRHTGHIYGYIPMGKSGTERIDILPTSMAPKSEDLIGGSMRITLDRLYVASYPGGGTHHVLFNFSAQNQLSSSQGEEVVHYNSTYRVKEREHASVQGFPIFVGLNVGSEGLVLKCRTVNVKNQEDEGLIGFLDSDMFKKGLRLATTFQSAVGQLSESAIGIFKFLAGRSQNVGVQDFTLGLDFSGVATRGYLAEGSYVAIQVPESKSTDWNWADWAFDPQAARIVRKSEPGRSVDFNYVVLGISKMVPEKKDV